MAGDHSTVRYSNYLIKGMVEDKTVELWSTKRLPFEPKGWLKDMREELKKELKLLQRNPTDILYGFFQSSSDITGYDVENILFYNVGNSAFSQLKNTDICFEKSVNNIEAPTKVLDKLVTSYSFYTLLPKDQLNTYWKKKNVLATFHIHNGLNEVEIANRLSVKLQIDTEKIREMLQDDSTNLLERRSIFNLYREDSLICNPADDLCVFVRIKIVPTDGPNSMISGELFSVIK